MPARTPERAGTHPETGGRTVPADGVQAPPGDEPGTPAATESEQRSTDTGAAPADPPAGTEGSATHPEPRSGPAPADRNQADSGSSPAAPEVEAESAPAPAATVTQLHVAVTENSTVPVEITVHPMVAAYKADVAKLGKAGTRQGLQVIEMAEKLVSSATSPAAAANLSKELTRMMDALEESSNDALVSQDPSLIIRDRTLAKLRAIQDAGVSEATA